MATWAARTAHKEKMEETNVNSGVAAIIETWPRMVKGLSPAEEMKARASLAAKISKCYELVSAVFHDDRNAEFRYSFASAETIYRTVRKGLSESGLAVIPFMGEFIEEPITKRRNNEDVRSGAYMVVNFEFVLMDSETGYSVAIPWRGEVMEYGDKAFNKASTNATKYFLRTLFLLPTDRAEDTDAAAEEGRPMVTGSNQSARSERPRRERVQPAEGENINGPGPYDPEPQPPNIIKTPEEARREAFYLVAYPYGKNKEHPLHAEQVKKWNELRLELQKADIKFLALCELLISEKPDGYQVNHEDLMARVRALQAATAAEQPQVAQSMEQAATAAPEAAVATEEAGKASDSPKPEEVAEKRKRAAAVASKPNKAAAVERLMKELELSANSRDILKMALELGFSTKAVIETVVAQNPEASLGDVVHYLNVTTEQKKNG